MNPLRGRFYPSNPSVREGATPQTEPMRLQLTVQRHGLPPTHVLWTTAGVRPNAGFAGADATISQLLEQINEVIPLEAEEWGLEDYTVEVNGFECLHFCALDQILREDDHVTYVHCT